jgi:ribosomal protein L11 methyltransferase
LGAELALGVDIDEASVKNSRENAENNGVDSAAFQLGLGSVDEVRAGAFSIKSAPLVLANILAPVLVRLFDAGLADLVEPGGALILSGILSHLAEGVSAAAIRQGLVVNATKQMGDWVALRVDKPGL